MLRPRRRKKPSQGRSSSPSRGFPIIGIFTINCHQEYQVLWALFDRSWRRSHFTLDQFESIRDGGWCRSEGLQPGACTPNASKVGPKRPMTDRRESLEKFQHWHLSKSSRFRNVLELLAGNMFFESPSAGSWGISHAGGGEWGLLRRSRAYRNEPIDWDYYTGEQPT